MQLVSAQANSNKQATIQPQHVIDALEQLEFSELSADIAKNWTEFQAGTGSKGAVKPNLEITEARRHVQSKWA